MMLSECIHANRHFGVCVCQRLREEITKLGFNEGLIRHYPLFDQASFRLVKDPYTGDHNLAGYWYDDRQQRIGLLQFNSDGTCYAEFDVTQPHPDKARWFVESVTAWGKIDQLKAEAKLLPMPA